MNTKGASSAEIIIVATVVLAVCLSIALVTFKVQENIAKNVFVINARIAVNDSINLVYESNKKSLNEGRAFIVKYNSLIDYSSKLSKTINMENSYVIVFKNMKTNKLSGIVTQQSKKYQIKDELFQNIDLQNIKTEKITKNNFKVGDTLKLDVLKDKNKTNYYKFVIDWIY